MEPARAATCDRLARSLRYRFSRGRVLAVGVACVTSANIIDEAQNWFSDERLPAVAAFLALSFILLLLRRC